jgi:hypothetical protein
VGVPPRRGEKGQYPIATLPNVEVQFYFGSPNGCVAEACVAEGEGRTAREI